MNDMEGTFDPLGEGAKGDWKKEGYKIKADNEPEDVGRGEDWIMYAVDKSGKEVGRLRVYDLGHRITSSDVSVDKVHQRKGIASAMYQYAEKKTGKRMAPADQVSDDPDNMTGDAKKLWGQPRRKFGEGKAGDWEQEGYTIKEGPHSTNAGHYSIQAFDKSGKMVGKAYFNVNSSSTKIIPAGISVSPDAQRKGLATAMYQFAEKVYAPISNKASHQTDAAKKFWSQPKRPFGKRKSESEMEGTFDPLGENEKPRYTADVILPGRNIIRDVKAEKNGGSWMISGDFATATIKIGGKIFIKDHKEKKIYFLKGNRMVFQDYFSFDDEKAADEKLK